MTTTSGSSIISALGAGSGVDYAKLAADLAAASFAGHQRGPAIHGSIAHASAAAPGTATPIARVDGRTLVADAEGLALAPKGAKGGYLVVSSQGDNAYTLYRLPGVIYAGRFRIGGGAIDGTSDTDGIELALGDFGPDYPKGLFVAQDGDNAPDTQNFKYVSWAKIVAALGL